MVLARLASSPQHCRRLDATLSNCTMAEMPSLANWLSFDCKTNPGLSLETPVRCDGQASHAGLHERFAPCGVPAYLQPETTYEGFGESAIGTKFAEPYLQPAGQGSIGADVDNLYQNVNDAHDDPKRE